MELFKEYLGTIENLDQRARMEEILNWISENFPALEPKVAWNQPMFTDHGTFIIGFSVSKQHIAVSPENFTIDHFSAAIKEVGYGHSSNLFRIKWSEPIHFSLLEKMILFNMEDKSDYSAFWRKNFNA